MRNMSHKIENINEESKSIKRIKRTFISKVYTEMKLSQPGFDSVGEQEWEKKIHELEDRWNEII